MQTFKQFLEAAVEKEPTFVRITQEEILDKIKNECSDALWMLTGNSIVIYRGENDSTAEMIDENLAMVVNPASTKRKSQNTSNYYTVIFDNHPEMKDFPKRSRSFISTTDELTAKHFGKVIVLIPCNGTKIGVVGVQDMWSISIKLFGIADQISGINDYFESLFINDEWESLVKFDALLKHDDPKARDRFYKVFQYAKPNEHKFFLERIIKAYSPKKTGFTWYTTKNLPHNLKHTELWVGGPCIALSMTTFNNLLRLNNENV